MSGIKKLVTSLHDEEIQLLQQLRAAVKKRRERPATQTMPFGARIADGVAAMVGEPSPNSEQAFANLIAMFEDTAAVPSSDSAVGASSEGEAAVEVPVAEVAIPPVVEAPATAEVVPLKAAPTGEPWDGMGDTSEPNPAEK